MMTPKEFALSLSKSKTFPRESNKDVYDRYNIIDNQLTKSKFILT